MSDMNERTLILGKKEGKLIYFLATVSWADEDGRAHCLTFEDPEAAETHINLLLGNITLEDLKP